MARKAYKTITQVVERTECDNGKIIRGVREEKYKIDVEPSYIKLYLDTLCTFKGLSTTLNPILAEFLRYMSFADTTENGGQTIYLNIELKKQIATATQKTLKRVEQALTAFVKTGMFRRTGTSTYQVNPYLFGRGDWQDIKSLRATFDFISGEVVPEIEHGAIGTVDGHDDHGLELPEMAVMGDMVGYVGPESMRGETQETL